MVFQGPDIQLKTPKQLQVMRQAGLVVQAALEAVRAVVRPGVTTAELDEVAHATIRARGATPSFLGYQGYPATICASVNDQVVHGIPHSRQLLREGDLVSVDCGAIVDGWHGDSAITVPVGQVGQRPLRLAQACEEAMWAGIKAARVGGRLSDISHAVEKAVGAAGQAHSVKYGIVRDYGGHGIGTEMHQDPHLLNYGKPGRGVTLLPGMALAVEPMITDGKPATRELSDGWTVVTSDGSWAAHTEHSFAILDDGLWVLTAADGGVSQLGDKASALAREHSLD